jgi:DNA-binding response OmpR family regulator
MDPGVPVIMMSTRSDEIDAVVALEIGADDYVTKPLRLRELVARMAAHLRRARLENAEAMRSRLEFRDLVIDVNERRTYKGGKEVELTHTEFDLLTFLASNAGKVLSREKILNSIWGYEYPIETRVIDVHIRNLRRKIETQPSRRAGRRPPSRSTALATRKSCRGVPAHWASTTWFRKFGWSLTPHGSVSMTVL